jgi:hypothetical protein
MAEGEGRTLHDAFENYGSKKAMEIIDEQGVNEMTFAEAMDLFEAWHPVEIEVKLYPRNQWVKAYKVKDGGR